MITKPDVEAALKRIRPSVHETPLVSATRLGKRSGDVHLKLKCESMQRTGSFKARGALNAMMQLTDADRTKGVVTVSTGNHADSDPDGVRHSKLQEIVRNRLEPSLDGLARKTSRLSRAKSAL